jgi:hypothetical protein
MEFPKGIEASPDISRVSPTGSDTAGWKPGLRSFWSPVPLLGYEKSGLRTPVLRAAAKKQPIEPIEPMGHLEFWAGHEKTGM